MNDKPAKGEIISLLEKHRSEPVPFDKLTMLLGLKKGDAPVLRKVLRKLAGRGIISVDHKGRYSIGADASGHKKAKSPPGKMVTGRILLVRGRPMLKLSSAPAGLKRLVAVKNAGGAKPGERVSALIEMTKGKRGMIQANVTGLLQASESFKDVSREFFKAHSIEGFRSRPIQESSLFIPSKKALHDEKRADLRDTYVVAIDPEGARDHDDAVSLEKTTGGWVLQVHIADVAEFVTPDSGIYKHASKKAFTLYLPWTAVPMLPPELSSDLCSLKEGKDRLALTCRMDISDTGELLRYRFLESQIRVDKFITYEKAQELEKTDPFLSMLDKFTSLVHQHRREAGIMDFELPEALVKLDESGAPRAIIPACRYNSYRWIEECMLLANRCAARFLKEHKLPGIHRVHEPPDPGDLVELSQLNGGSLPAGQSGFSEELENDPKALKGIRQWYASLLGARTEDGAPLPVHLQRKILRTMKKAMYSPKSLGHFALGFSSYAHFTSPIRRFPDLWNHRLIKSALLGRKLPKALKKEAADLAINASEREIEIMKLERKGMRTAMAWILHDKAGKQFDAHISGMDSNGIWVFVEEEGLFGEGWVSLAMLRDDYYEYSERDNIITGRRTHRVFTMGEKVRVQLEKTDPVRGFVDFSIVAQIAPV